ncbi:MAG: DUF484 family protein [Gammaproteobacteria bacterium]|nr:DUF484 family protein [Gammaproteobacteria bacterium]MDH3375149.1 DUF484 family protein [Gammaproteobacteria bacterium]MDH3409438.1 DUF484 family protein [Gammaproteobacteria bacterium]MDH3551558.1 DUF484 family protein [Gammaproteobacteria bacterium]
MSTQRKPEFLDQDISEQAIQDYLEEHPDFFERHKILLGRLELPHGAGGSVSLVERQVSTLRQKELKLERQLKELIEVARANDVLSAKIHELTLQLFAARDLQACVSAIEQAMRRGFNADHSILVLFGDSTMFEDIESGRFFRVVDRNDATLGPFDTFLQGRGPRCGQVRDSQREFLFHDDAEEIGSVALVPLGDKARIGFLAIGSVDTNRFHPGMSIDFLARVGDLVAAALKRY